MTRPRVVIIGAGPTGLAAAHRLTELGHDEWIVLEADDEVGGLARSYTVDGYTFDIGGHVLFSRDDGYLALLDRLLGRDCTTIRREAWIWIQDRHVRYPFQNHLGALEPPARYECLSGLVEAHVEAARGRPPVGNFRDWVQATFGTGIARHFMLPYNAKVWATPPEQMTYDWISERVSLVDLDTVLRNVVLGIDGPPWGPNSTFRYPLRGGTGRLWQRLAEPLAERIRLGCRVVGVDAAAHLVHTSDGRRVHYDRLLSTMPLDDLVALCRDAPAAVRHAAAGLVAIGTHVVGVAIDRPTDPGRNWIYYPGVEVPFHRLTYLSNYSPHMTPAPGQTLLLTETSTSAYRPVAAGTIVARVLDGLCRIGLLRDSTEILTTWRCTRGKSYPVPTLGRDRALGTIRPWLGSRGIAAEGRLGSWRYERGNMDHAVDAGVRWADELMGGVVEEKGP